MPCRILWHSATGGVPPAGKRLPRRLRGGDDGLRGGRLRDASGARPHRADLAFKFESTYHGNHDYSLTSTFPTRTGEDPHGQDNTAGRPEGAHRTICVAPCYDPGAARRIVGERGGEIAAIIVEPVQRIIAAKSEFLRGRRRTYGENGIVFINEG